MKKYNRIFLVITDSLGIGGDKRAKEFGDKGANTFYHVSQTGLLDIPNWKRLGIDSVVKLEGFNKAINQMAYTAKMQELSNAKDTLAGHWEFMGIVTTEPFASFTDNGFPPEMIEALSNAFDGKTIIGNKAASGTEILKELAQQSIDNDQIIVYTSADSVLQICGHETHLGLEKLYEYCEKARQICDGNTKWKVGRVIARPFIGENGEWTRTTNRHDYVIKLPEETILNSLQRKEVQVVSIGKIFDIFDGQGIDQSFPSKSDGHGMDMLIELASKASSETFVFVNLVQFDSEFGHRRNPDGYAENINLFDIKLAKLLNAMQQDDLLIITSDHGNDPTFSGTDHTREQVPVTIYAKNFEVKPKKLKDFIGFATIGNIIAKNFDLPLSQNGEDRFDEIN